MRKSDVGFWECKCFYDPLDIWDIMELQTIFDDMGIPPTTKTTFLNVGVIVTEKKFFLYHAEIFLSKNS